MRSHKQTSSVISQAEKRFGCAELSRVSGVPYTTIRGLKVSDWTNKAVCNYFLLVDASSKLLKTKTVKAQGATRPKRQRHGISPDRSK